MQERALGTPVTLSAARRGDLIFWKGHVAIVRDRGTMIHANAHHMAVAIEPRAEASRRIEAAGLQVTSVRRITV
jgi:cell wall-associated NlpC family hydrolase